MDDYRLLMGSAILLIGALLWLVLPMRRPIAPRPAEPPNAVSSEWDSRKTLFTPGAHYRVKQSFQSFGTWTTGEELIFNSVAYGAYENTHFYSFTVVGNGERTWRLNDAEPAESWKQYFEPL